MGFAEPHPRLRVGVVLAFAATLAAGSCKKTNVELGGECELHGDCHRDLQCVEERCAPRRKVGEPCDSKRAILCERTLSCTPGNVCQTLAWVAERARQEGLERERKMLLESGIDPKRVDDQQGAAESPAPPTGSGAAVRVVVVESEGPGFAACRADERLIGGTCSVDKASGFRSAPEGFSASDTVGARWTCDAPKNRKTTSTALCQRVGSSSPK